MQLTLELDRLVRPLMFIPLYSGGVIMVACLATGFTALRSLRTVPVSSTTKLNTTTPVLSFVSLSGFTHF
jgi:hypothetical protein